MEQQRVHDIYGVFFLKYILHPLCDSVNIAKA